MFKRQQCMENAGTEVTGRVQGWPSWSTQRGNQGRDQKTQSHVGSTQIILKKRSLGNSEGTDKKNIGPDELVDETVKPALGGADRAEGA